MDEDPSYCSDSISPRFACEQLVCGSSLVFVPAVTLNKLLPANYSSVLLLQEEQVSLVFLVGIAIDQELRHGEGMSSASCLMSRCLELHKVHPALFQLCLR